MGMIVDAPASNWTLELALVDRYCPQVASDSPADGFAILKRFRVLETLSCGVLLRPK
jgi:hypothetical protein